jgi:hypothetical protein
LIQIQHGQIKKKIFIFELNIFPDYKLVMPESTSLVKLKQHNKREYIELPFTVYFHDILETSYKRWSLKELNQNWENDSWESHDLDFSLFSTGKASLSGKMVLNNNKVLFNWRVELFDKNRNQILSIGFANIVFNNSKLGKARRIKFEKRIRNVDTAFISKVFIARIYSEP